MNLVDFAVGAEREGRAWVVAPAGELDLENLDAVRAAVASRPPDCDTLVLDLSALTFLDTSGMRLVMEAFEDARSTGRRLALVRGSEVVQRMFVLARLQDRLPFFDDVRAAIDDR